MSIKKPRLREYDYASNGFYFVTIVTHNRQPLFIGANRAVVARFIGQLNETPGVSVDYFTVMDDHVHMILVLNECLLTLGEIVRRFKARTTHELNPLPDKSGDYKTPLWQPNYYEHVIRNDQALLKIREYIQNNPQAEKIKWEQIYKALPNELGLPRSRPIHGAEQGMPDKSGGKANTPDESGDYSKRCGKL